MPAAVTTLVTTRTAPHKAGRCACMHPSIPLAIGPLVVHFRLPSPFSRIQSSLLYTCSKWPNSNHVSNGVWIVELRGASKRLARLAIVSGGSCICCFCLGMRRRFDCVAEHISVIVLRGWPVRWRLVRWRHLQLVAVECVARSGVQQDRWQFDREAALCSRWSCCHRRRCSTAACACSCLCMSDASCACLCECDRCFHGSQPSFDADDASHTRQCAARRHSQGAAGQPNPHTFDAKAHVDAGGGGTSRGSRCRCRRRGGWVCES